MEKKFITGLADVYLLGKVSQEDVVLPLVVQEALL
jgi:hypothetical protein